MPDAAPGTRVALGRFKRWFWRPPRPHGDTIVDRRVSPLELLYDLVYVAVIAQAANHLIADTTVTSLIEFTVVFSMIWFAWCNGSLYLELHGRADGRTRSYVFVQIGILAVLAIFAADTGGDGGRAFALAYAAFLIVMTWLWYTVRRQDRLERPEFLADTGRYVIAMAISVAAVTVSAFLADEARLIVWASLAIGWGVFFEVMGRARIGLGRGLAATDSLVERFGLFTIIVLGELVFGVVDGLSIALHDVTTIATGMIALVLGFGFWWIYFDVVGGRLPKKDGRALANWILSHYPITLSIAVAGAGMVSLIGHAHDGRTPGITTLLLSGAVAVGLLGIIPAARALADAEPLSSVYQPLTMFLVIGAVVAALVGWARPAPWLFALLLVLILSLIWAIAVRGFLLAGVWGAERETIVRT